MEVILIMDRIITVDDSLKPERIGYTDLNVTEKGYTQVRRSVPGSIQHKNYMEYYLLGSIVSLFALNTGIQVL